MRQPHFRSSQGTHTYGGEAHLVLLNVGFSVRTISSGVGSDKEIMNSVNGTTSPIGLYFGISLNITVFKLRYQVKRAP